MPQAVALLAEIREYPPINMLATELLQGIARRNKTALEKHLDEKLGAFGSHVQSSAPAEAKPIRRNRAGNRVLQMVVKKTGKRIA